jgi:ribosomal protein S12
MVIGWSLTGCKSKDKQPKHRTLHGTVSTIDTSNGTVAMNWFNENLGKSMVVAGKITKDTEIYIDGKLGDITHIQENDEVSVEGFKKGTDIVAVKVMITRNATQSQTIKKPTPTSQPAESL